MADLEFTPFVPDPTAGPDNGWAAYADPAAAADKERAEVAMKRMDSLVARAIANITAARLAAAQRKAGR
jgi:hypothetical protein